MLRLFLTATEGQTNELVEKYMEWVKSLDIYRDFVIKLPSPLDNAYFFGIMIIVIGILATVFIISTISNFMDRIHYAKERRHRRRREREHDQKMKEIQERKEELELRREERELRMEAKEDRRYEAQQQSQRQSQELLDLYIKFTLAAKVQGLTSLQNLDYEHWLTMYNKQQSAPAPSAPSVIYQGTSSDYVDATVRDVPVPTPNKKEKPVKEKVTKEKPVKVKEPKEKKESALKGLFAKKERPVVESAPVEVAPEPVAAVATEPVIEEPVVAPVVETPVEIPKDIYEDEPETITFTLEKEEEKITEESEKVSKPTPAPIYIVPDDDPEDIVEIPEYDDEEPEEEIPVEAAPEPIDTSDVEEEEEDLSSMDTEDAFAMLLRSIQAEEHQQKSIDKDKTQKQNERAEALSQLNDETVKHSADVKTLNSSDEIERKKEQARIARERELAKEEAKRKKKKK